MTIKVIGGGCDNCHELYDNVLEAMLDTGTMAEIEQVEDLVEIVKLGVMSLPALIIDGKIVISGRVAKVKEIKKYL